MGEMQTKISTGNLPENPPKPRRGKGWIPRDAIRSGPDKCDGCGHMKDPSEFSTFYAKEISLNADEEIPFLCNYCARYGAPMSDPLAGLNLRERQGMLIMASGGMVSDAARRMDISKEKLRDVLNGRERGIFREAFQRLLSDAGLGPDAIVEALSRSLKGKKQHYNAVEGKFEEFDDLSAQGRAIDMLVKLWDLKPPQELSRNVTPGRNMGVQVNVITNVGDGKTPREEAYEIEGVVIDE